MSLEMGALPTEREIEFDGDLNIRHPQKEYIYLTIDQFNPIDSFAEDQNFLYWKITPIIVFFWIGIS